LCARRGGKYQLRLMVDDLYPPATRLLSHWNFRAEFWIDGIGSKYGTDTTNAGTYLYLSTDQVRFYRLDAPQLVAQIGSGAYHHPSWSPHDPVEPVPLTEIPPLIF